MAGFRLLWVGLEPFPGLRDGGRCLREVDVRFYSAERTPGTVRGCVDNESPVGWTVGGIEAQVTRRMSLRGEYLYADLGEQDASYEDFLSFYDNPIQAMTPT